MALQGINHSEYSRLLGKVNSLSNEEANGLLQELTRCYGHYHELLSDLQEIIDAYEKVAGRIRARKTLKKEIDHQQVI
jgi:hypothetical protein